VIAAVEAEYEQIWVQDVAAMVGYQADASAAASLITPWATVPGSGGSTNLGA
jgi:PPE-repeat protein